MRNDVPTFEDLCMVGAVAHLKAARNRLQCAVLRFDDAGFEHDPTARAYSFVAAIVAEMDGRPAPPPNRPVIMPVPSIIAEAAREYRRQAKRSY